MASDYEPAKGLYRFSPARWLKTEEPRFLEFQRSPEAWAQAFAGPQLGGHVPHEIVAHFEMSRGAMAYACFFYPLATLGFENCTRTVELAVRLRAEASGGGKKDFFDNLKLLVERGIVPSADEASWNAARKLRNAASHPDGRFLTDPGQALSFLYHTAERIDFLFPAASSAALGDRPRP